LRWLARQRANLLPVPYYHVVFTLPEELRDPVRRYQRALLDVLFRAAYGALAALCADPRYVGARVAALAVLHTWSRDLGWHPHVHMLVSGGGLAPEGRTWRTSRRRPRRKPFLVPVKALSRGFRGRFLALARRAVPTLAIPEAVGKKNWVVFAKPCVAGDPEHTLGYLGRYVHRTALSDKRILAIDEHGVTFSYRSSADDRIHTMTLSAEEFLRRFLQHVPPRGFHRVRAFGLLHPSARGTLRRLQLLLGVSPPDPFSPRIPPLRCPACADGVLRLVRRLSATECAVFVIVSSPQARAPPRTLALSGARA
jgi:hypothetical protein